MIGISKRKNKLTNTRRRSLVTIRRNGMQNLKDMLLYRKKELKVLLTPITEFKTSGKAFVELKQSRRGRLTRSCAITESNEDCNKSDTKKRPSKLDKFHKKTKLIRKEITSQNSSSSEEDDAHRSLLSSRRNVRTNKSFEKLPGDKVLHFSDQFNISKASLALLKGDFVFREFRIELKKLPDSVLISFEKNIECMEKEVVSAEKDVHPIEKVIEPTQLRDSPNDGTYSHVKPNDFEVNNFKIRECKVVLHRLPSVEITDNDIQGSDLGSNMDESDLLNDLSSKTSNRTPLDLSKIALMIPKIVIKRILLPFNFGFPVSDVPLTETETPLEISQNEESRSASPKLETQRRHSNQFNTSSDQLSSYPETTCAEIVSIQSSLCPLNSASIDSDASVVLSHDTTSTTSSPPPTSSDLTNSTEAVTSKTNFTSDSKKQIIPKISHSASSQEYTSLLTEPIASDEPTAAKGTSTRNSSPSVVSHFGIISSLTEPIASVEPVAAKGTSTRNSSPSVYNHSGTITSLTEPIASGEPTAAKGTSTRNSLPPIISHSETHPTSLHNGSADSLFRQPTSPNGAILPQNQQTPLPFHQSIPKHASPSLQNKKITCTQSTQTSPPLQVSYLNYISTSGFVEPSKESSSITVPSLKITLPTTKQTSHSKSSVSSSSGHKSSIESSHSKSKHGHHQHKKNEEKEREIEKNESHRRYDSLDRSSNGERDGSRKRHSSGRSLSVGRSDSYKRNFSDQSRDKESSSSRHHSSERASSVKRDSRGHHSNHLYHSGRSSNREKTSNRHRSSDNSTHSHQHHSLSSRSRSKSIPKSIPESFSSVSELLEVLMGENGGKKSSSFSNGPEKTSPEKLPEIPGLFSTSKTYSAVLSAVNDVNSSNSQNSATLPSTRSSSSGLQQSNLSTSVTKSTHTSSTNVPVVSSTNSTSVTSSTAISSGFKKHVSTFYPELPQIPAGRSADPSRYIPASTKSSNVSSSHPPVINTVPSSCSSGAKLPHTCSTSSIPVTSGSSNSFKPIYVRVKMPQTSGAQAVIQKIPNGPSYRSSSQYIYQPSSQLSPSLPRPVTRTPLKNAPQLPSFSSSNSSVFNQYLPSGPSISPSYSKFISKGPGYASNIKFKPAQPSRPLTSRSYVVSEALFKPPNPLISWSPMTPVNHRVSFYSPSNSSYTYPPFDPLSNPTFSPLSPKYTSDNGSK